MSEQVTSAWDLVVGDKVARCDGGEVFLVIELVDDRKVLGASLDAVGAPTLVELDMDTGFNFCN